MLHATSLLVTLTDHKYISIRLELWLLCSSPWTPFSSSHSSSGGSCFVSKTMEDQHFACVRGPFRCPPLQGRSTASLRQNSTFWAENEKKTKLKNAFLAEKETGRKHHKSPFSAPKTKPKFGRSLLSSTLSRHRSHSSWGCCCDSPPMMPFHVTSSSHKHDFPLSVYWYATVEWICEGLLPL